MEFDGPHCKFAHNGEYSLDPLMGRASWNWKADRMEEIYSFPTLHEKLFNA
jgi:hypothetical protein